MARHAALAVDPKAAFNVVGLLTTYVSLTSLFPAAVALAYGEPFWPFLAAGATALIVGLGLTTLTAGAPPIGMREGYLVVAATWIFVAAFGALPYVFTGGELGNPLDAYFEAMSGFTTTGASVVTDYEALSKSVAMWRQFTQWLGGMGIIVLALAVLPRLRVGGRQLMAAELPGPETARFAERVRATARRLWLLYVGLTAAEVLALSVLGWPGTDGRMTPYEAVSHAFTTVSTGGFSTQATSLEAFSAAAQWIVIVFMILAGANFALMYRGIVRRQPRAFVWDEELRLYLAVITVATVGLSIQVWSYGIIVGEGAIRASVFQVVSIVTSTGYASTDFALWPVLSLLTIFALMFVGGSAGSTGGGIKIVRHLLTGRILRRELSYTLSAELVKPIRLNGLPVEERTLRAIAAFVLLYVGAWVVGSAVIAVDSAIIGVQLGPLDSLAASATAIGNIGPGFGITGPFGSFQPLGEVSKVTMIALMWVGRLEIIPVAILMTRNYWRV
ncbi:TrkH family potassium uptake protein [soil metagenome]